MNRYKMQSQAKAQTLGWEDVQEMQQQKKAHKQFRANRQNRKGLWMPAE